MPRLVAALGLLVLTLASHPEGVAGGFFQYALSGVVQQKDDGDVSSFSLEWELRLGDGSSTATIQFPAFPLVIGKQKVKGPTERSANFTKDFEVQLGVLSPGSKPKVDVCKFPHLYFADPDVISGSAKFAYTQRISGKRHKLRLLGYFAGSTSPM